MNHKLRFYLLATVLLDGYASATIHTIRDVPENVFLPPSFELAYAW